MPLLRQLEDAGTNRVELMGRLLERGALRHTPAGVPVVELRLGHASDQEEGGGTRRVECEVPAVALGTPAHLLAAAKLGDQMAVTGFLAARSLKRQTLVLHVTNVEFKEGNENGIQTQVHRQA